jgi:hypothetical protein
MYRAKLTGKNRVVVWEEKKDGADNIAGNLGA